MKAVAFDFGHTLVDELTADVQTRLMPGVREVVPRLDLPLAVWANTREANEAALLARLKTAGLESYLSVVVTSIDAGFRKPAPEFFRFALSKWSYAATEILFVCNQLNTDVLGAESFGIRTAWISAPEFRSADETMTLNDVQPSFILARLADLPALLSEIAV